MQYCNCHSGQMKVTGLYTECLSVCVLVHHEGRHEIGLLWGLAPVQGE
uniref:Uncharacterized protein n=1 Tax=Anguilla anguilla TaxID=7936 RepID=A0A0E9WCC7_ANGAN